ASGQREPIGIGSEFPSWKPGPSADPEIGEAMIPRKSRKILIIDDNPVLSTVMLKFARHGAHNHLEVQVAADGLAGFQEACARRPDIILLDYVMPVHDGLAFLDLYALE